MKEDPTVREIQRFVEAIPRPHPGLRARVMAAVPPDQQTKAGPRWAVAMAVLLAALVVGTLVLGIRGSAPRARPAVQPTHGLVASPAPAPARAAGQLNVPDSTPVIMLDSRAAAITWTGQRGTLGVESRLGPPFHQSPDGSRFLVGSTVFDRHGAALGDLPQTPSVGQVWADDSRHLCNLMLAAGGPATLQLLQPGQPAHHVVEVGSPDAKHIRVEACSVLADRAVVSEASDGGDEQVWLVQLSNARVLRHSTYPATPSSTPGVPRGTTNIKASRDGSLLAVMTGPWTPIGAGQTTTVIRLSDGAVLARLDGRVIMGFSWDGTLAVTDPNLDGKPSVVRWQTGAVLWTSRINSVTEPIPEPNGTRIAVGQLNGDIWIVGPDGRARLAVTNDLLPPT